MSHQVEALVIDARMKSIPVTLQTDEGDKKVSVVTMNGTDRDNYMVQLLKRTSKDANGTINGVKDPKGMFADLLTKTLRNEETGELFDRPSVQSLPAPVSKELFEVAKTLNGLGEDEDDEEVGKGEEGEDLDD